MTVATDRLRVSKTFSPSKPGALKLARKYGDALICVRYRVDADNAVRYTTVELIVDRAEVLPRSDPIVGLRISFDEKALRAAVKAKGGSWDGVARLWRLPYSAVIGLHLRDRIVRNERSSNDHP